MATSRMRSALLGTALAASLSLGLGGEAKAATIFNVTSFVVTLGTGFDTNPAVADVNKIDLSYSGTGGATPWNFSLTTSGQSDSRNFGNFLVREDCNASSVATCQGNASFSVTEVNQPDKTVSVAVTFTLPVATTLTFNATVTPVQGLLRDTVLPAAADLTLSFAAQTVSFGNGGSFTVDPGDVLFTSCEVDGSTPTGPTIRRCAESQIANATVTLTVAETPVPEPAALAVLGMGLLGLAAVGRRRRRIG